MAKKPAKTVAVVCAITLAEIVAASIGEVGFLYTPADVHVPLIEAELVELNPELMDANGWIATRATQKGIDEVNTKVETQYELPNVAPVAAGKFVLEANVPVPTIKRGGHKNEMYPFAVMEVGQSFFVAATEAKPNPAKTLASTVSGATKRFAVPTGAVKKNRKGEDVEVMQETRKFVVRSVEENGIKGARVWRSV